MRHLKAVPATPFSGDLPYGREYSDTEDWGDADGNVYRSDNPPILRLRRAVDRFTRRAA